jgi:hypothetical protein
MELQITLIALKLQTNWCTGNGNTGKQVGTGRQLYGHETTGKQVVELQGCGYETTVRQVIELQVC